MRFFFFGTLMDRDVMAVVLGRAPGHLVRRPAALAGHRRVQVAGETFPMLTPDPAGTVEGVLTDGLAASELDRILFFESVEYASRAVEVVADGSDRVTAQAFLPSERAGEGASLWDFADWQRQHKAQALREAVIWMGLHGHLDSAEADRLWDEALASGEALDAMVRRVQAAAPAPAQALASPPRGGIHCP